MCIRDRGKGFQGAIKRLGQHRGPMAHGSKCHRHQGSNGACSSPSKVFKGKGMPGHMGSCLLYTSRRVEVATPVYDAHAKDKIRHIFDTIMTDDEKGKELCADGEYMDRKINSTPIDSQEQFFEEDVYKRQGS